MKDICAGAQSRQFQMPVCRPLKATVSAHHLAEVNGPTQAVDLLIFSMPWVTE